MGHDSRNIPHERVTRATSGLKHSDKVAAVLGVPTDLNANFTLLTSPVCRERYMENICYVRFSVEFHNLPAVSADDVSRLRAAVDEAIKGLHPKPQRRSDIMVTVDEPSVALRNRATDA